MKNNTLKNVQGELEEYETGNVHEEISEDLQTNEIGDEGAQVIAEALKTKQEMTNEISDEGAQALFEALKTMPGMKNKILGEGAQTLFEALEKGGLKLGQRLDLGGNKILGEGAQTLFEASEKGGLKLGSRLDLGGNQIGEEGEKEPSESINYTAGLNEGRIMLGEKEPPAWLNLGPADGGGRRKVGELKKFEKKLIADAMGVSIEDVNRDNLWY